MKTGKSPPNSSTPLSLARLVEGRWEGSRRVSLPQAAATCGVAAHPRRRGGNARPQCIVEDRMPPKRIRRLRDTQMDGVCHSAPPPRIGSFCLTEHAPKKSCQACNGGKRVGWGELEWAGTSRRKRGQQQAPRSPSLPPPPKGSVWGGSADPPPHQAGRTNRNAIQREGGAHSPKWA